MENKKHLQNQQLNHLIIYCNPDSRSLSAAYRDALVQLTETSGNAVNVRDLYNIGFRPVLEQADLEAVKYGQIPPDIKVEQDYILWAHLLTFIYPIWWASMPALMKGYIDRVLTRGFAYTMDETKQIQGLLKEKKVIILNNMGCSYDDYEKTGMLQSLRQTTDEGIFAFCGMEVLEHRFFGRMDSASENEREGHVNVLEMIYSKYF